MSITRHRRWSNALLIMGSILMLLASVVGFLNAAVVNGERFAGVVNEIRADDPVKDRIGDAVAAAALDVQPDLVAIEPAIAAGASAVVGSSALDGVFTTAVRSFHDAMTQAGSNSAVLQLADLGATLTTALERFVPQAAEIIPKDLNVTLAEIGGQAGWASRIVPAIGAIATLAWVLPVLAVVLLALSVLLAPVRRRGIVRVGWSLVAVGGFLGLIVLAMNVAGALMDSSTLSGAVLGAALTEFSRPLAARFIGTVVLGGLIVAAAGALMPQFDVGKHVRAAGTVATRRPENPGWAVVRALALVALGLAMILMPEISATLVAVAAGFLVVLIGITELDVVAEAARERERAERGHAGAEAVVARRRGREVRWLIPAAAVVGGLAVLAALLIPGHLPQSSFGEPVAATSEACNGHEELCDRRFDEVAIPASHNSMSVADGTWFLAEQPKDMIASLDDGIRGLLVDTWYAQPTKKGAITSPKSLERAEAELVATYGEEVVGSIRRTIDRVRDGQPTGPEQPYFCHTVCELGASPMQPMMERLNAWLEEHPRDVVVLFIQDMVTPADTAAVLDAAGLAQKAYVHPAGAQWPTLREMVDAGQQLVVLMENTGGGQQFPFLHQGFDLVQDTEYTFGTAGDFTCTIKRGSPTGALFNVNHWLASFTKLVTSAEQVNAYDVLKPRVEACQQERGLAPTMVSVNWYDRGDLFRVVDELNGVA